MMESNLGKDTARAVRRWGGGEANGSGVRMSEMEANIPVKAAEDGVSVPLPPTRRCTSIGSKT